LARLSCNCPQGALVYASLIMSAGLPAAPVVRRSVMIRGTQIDVEARAPR